ncbi:MAG: hemerythrin domain-containing protein [Planctomycetota bacterium]|jgi:hemerythrin-like domain-containing protein|nr:hemerythrin domain-containing protein [Planctomycetota bacterium]MDP6940838.1 hemerythrin domain-containing protein [Planctomycetota bacterium]
MPENTSSPSFADLAFVHEGLMELLLAHQECVALGELNEARSKLEAFIVSLKDHISKEDTHLIPIFSQRVEEQVGCTAELLLAEHRKLERLMEKALARIVALEKVGSISGRERVAVIEEEHMLKEVLKHHDERERAAFFPNLDRVIQGEERKEILRDIGLLHNATN